MIRKIGSTCLLLAAMAVGTSAAAQETAGTATKVISDVVGTYDGNERLIVVGGNVLHNEVIKTGATASTVIKFIDETVLELGPGTELQLDEFVYNPNSNQGSMRLSLKTGFMRMASGLLPSESYQINTPVATIGIRGTVIKVFQEPNGDLSISVDEGETDVESNSSGVKVTIRAEDVNRFLPPDQKLPDYATLTQRTGELKTEEQPEVFKEFQAVIEQPEIAKQIVTKVVIEQLKVNQLADTCNGSSKECEEQAQAIKEKLNQPYIDPQLKDEALKETTKQIIENTPLENLTKVLTTISGGFSTPEQQKVVEEIVEKIETTGEVPDAEEVEDAIEESTETSNTTPGTGTTEGTNPSPN